MIQPRFLPLHVGMVLIKKRAVAVSMEAVFKKSSPLLNGWEEGTNERTGSHGRRRREDA